MLRRFYTLNPRARLVEDRGRRYLLCDFPLQQFELNDTAWQVISALRPATALSDLVSSERPELTDFLEEKVVQGALRAEYTHTPPAHFPAVEVIIPVLSNPEGLARCLAALAQVDYPPDLLRVTVVDDGSPQSQQTAVAGRIPAGLALRWIRLERNVGPASARNAALEQPSPDGARTPAPLCAFLDSDCVPQPGWLQALVSVLEDPAIAAACGQVVGLRRDTWVARYEDDCSSLNLGPKAGTVGGVRTRFSYAPTCNLVVRRAALTQVGNFRPGLRLGEDVDLCWRLHAQGSRLFYYPPGRVAHVHRDRLLPMLNRKRAYATSESWLRRTHPGHQPRGELRGIGSVSAFAGAILLLSLPAGVAVLLLGLLFEAGFHRLRRMPSGLFAPEREIAVALSRRALAGFAQVCRLACRQWGCVGLLAAILVPAFAPAFLVALAVAIVAEGVRLRPRQPWWEFAAAMTLEVIAYSMGRIQGRVRQVCVGETAPTSLR